MSSVAAVSSVAALQEGDWATVKAKETAGASKEAEAEAQMVVATLEGSRAVMMAAGW